MGATKDHSWLLVFMYIRILNDVALCVNVIPKRNQFPVSCSLNIHPTWSANAATFCPETSMWPGPGTLFGGLSSSGKTTSCSWNTSCTLTIGSLFNQPVTVNHEDDISGIPNQHLHLWRDCYYWVGGVDAKHTLLTRKTPCAVVLREAEPMGFLGWRSYSVLNGHTWGTGTLLRSICTGSSSFILPNNGSKIFLWSYKYGWGIYLHTYV